MQTNSNAITDPKGILFWWKWLVGADIFVILFGLDFIVFPKVTHRLFNRLFFGSPESGFSAAADDYVIFVYSVLGAVMIGWMINLLYLIIVPFRQGEKYAWSAISLSITIWFVIDSAVSLFYGYWPNALLNSGLLILFIVPLSATRKYFS